MTPLVAYALLFVAVGIGFIFVHLLAGKFIRPSKPAAEKLTIYECGEPTIGSSWIQFDLRFYVVALLFVIFDVEVAFFFPWAEVFGKANAVAEVGQPANLQAYHDLADRALEMVPPYDTIAVAQYKRLQALTQQDLDRLNELTAKGASGRTRAEKLEWEALHDLDKLARETQTGARSLAWLAFVEILIFFGVLLVGFAYLWKRGDLAWVRSMGERQPAPAPRVSVEVPAAPAEQPLVGAGGS